MIVLSNTNELINSFDIEKEALQYQLFSEENKKNIILNYIQNFADSTDNVDLNSTDSFVELFNDLKNSLNLCNENIAYIDNLISNLSELSNCLYDSNNNVEFKQVLNVYNSKYIDANKHVLENNKRIDNSLLQVSKKALIHFPSSTTNDNEPDNYQEKTSATSPAISEDTSTNDESYDNNNTDNTYRENTLVISERSGHVILPYKISELNELLEKEPNRYFSIDSVISKKYTLPFRIFKNSFISRFREAFKLMKKREKSSIRDAFDLGLELMFYYKLHPAIISACKNLEELDTYLDYLEMGRIDKFDCFKIVFELPLAVQHKI